MTHLLPRWNLTHASLRLFQSPLSLVIKRNTPQVSRELQDVFCKLLRVSPQPTMQRNPEFKNVIRDLSIPANVTSDGVGLARDCHSEKNASLSTSIQHRSALGHSANNVARKIRTEGNEFIDRLCVQESSCLGNLLILPSRHVAIWTSRNQHRGSQMDLLNRKIIGKHQRQNLRLLLSSPARQAKGQQSDDQRNQRCGSSRNGRCCIPVPSSPRNVPYFYQYAQFPIPLWHGRHSDTCISTSGAAHG